MRPLGPLVLAASMAALTACTSQHQEPVAFVPDHVDVGPSSPSLSAAPTLVSDFDNMRADLPGFDLKHSDTDHGDVSVMRDLTFPAGSSIMSRHDVTRLVALQAYLHANPTVRVRVEGFGDGLKSVERNAELSTARAQAVARALSADIIVGNSIVVAGPRVLQDGTKNGLAEITFVRPAP